MNPRLASLLLAGGALALTAGPAAAATALGQTAPGPATGGCTNCGQLQLESAPGSTPYVVPAGGGVITSWSFRDTGPATAARLRLFAPGPGPGQYTLVAQTPYRNFGLGEGGSTQTQIPVTAGTHLGVAVTAGDQAYLSFNDGDKVSGNFDVNAPIGAPALVTPTSEYRTNIAAVLEPDADHDGYGDETQDGCPSDPTRQTKCLLPPPPSMPPPAPAPAPPVATPIVTVNNGPLVTLIAPRRESIKSGFVMVSATTAGDVTLAASGTIGTVKLGSASKALRAGDRTTLLLKIPKKTLRTTRERLTHHKRVSAKVTVTTGAGTSSIRVRLVR